VVSQFLLLCVAIPARHVVRQAVSCERAVFYARLFMSRLKRKDADAVRRVSVKLVIAFAEIGQQFYEYSLRANAMFVLATCYQRTCVVTCTSKWMAVPDSRSIAVFS
jgi:hypothetical protein